MTQLRIFAAVSMGVNSGSNGGSIFVDVVGNITQAVQRIALHISLCFHGRIAQLRARFDEQDEQHTVHIPQAFHRERGGVHRIGVQVAPLSVGEVIQNLVAEQLNALS